MRPRREIVRAGLFTVALCAALLLRGSLASGASCITTVAGDVCLAQCIGSQQQACGSDPVCHQGIAAALRMLAGASADTAECADLVANVRQVCGCVASPSGAFLDTSGALF